jgi:ribonuclease E
LYLFNHKRDRLTAIEARYAMRVIFNGDSSLTAANFRIEKLRAQTAPLPAPVYRPAITEDTPQPDVADIEDETETEAAEDTPPPAGETAEEGERRRRRRRRRGKRRPDSAAPDAATGEPAAAGETQPVEQAEPADDEPTEIDLVIAAELGDQPEPGTETSEEPARRRRSRGGRRRRPAAEGEEQQVERPAPPPPEPFYRDVADIFEAAERAEAEALRIRAESRLTAAPAEPAAAVAMQDDAEAHFAPAGAEDSNVHVAINALPEPLAEAEPMAPPAVEPLVKPILVSADAPVQEKKRGWWRR